MKPPFDIAGDLDTPVSAFMKLASFAPRFLLESVEGGERLARYSFIGFGNGLEVRLDRDGFTIGGERRPVPRTRAELLAGLRTALQRATNSLGGGDVLVWREVPPQLGDVFIHLLSGKAGTTP